MDFLKKYRQKKIIGEKIELRDIRKTDLPSCIKWLKDPEVTKFLSSSVKNVTEAEELQWYKSIKKSKNDIVFSIIVIFENKYIGNCGLHKIDWIDKICELGIFIGERNYWNKGFGTAAIILLLDFAVNTIGIKTVRLFVYEYNLRAKKVYEKCGFTVKEILRDHHLFDNKYWDTYVMEYNRITQIAS